ncbi:MAG TPA: MarR family transcriptional regulator [Solirubrobacteraceae bacterium]|nr:MarR family transcriptional regulator [Solirubrobacteraceae bacterium]
MIDRIRQDIQTRLDQLLAEADRLRQALTALGADNGSSRSSARAGSSTARSTAARSTAARSAAAPKRAARATQTRSRTSSARTTRRASSGGTKSSVLKALGEADGKALTASEVASTTGLGRASVSTTLSKLARAGEVEKADRGYRLATNSGSPASA